MAASGLPAVEKSVDKPVDNLSQPPVHGAALAPRAVDDSVEKPVRAPVHRPVLLLRLEGPLQSWGLRSRWDVRDTAPEPTKSGVIGLLGCALGCPVGDSRLEDLDRGLRFGIRVESPGRVMEDYQTVTGFLPAADGRYRRAGVTNTASREHLTRRAHAAPATIVSPRRYLEDAAFLVALEETGAVPGLLAQCAAAVRAPAWPLYLGRKSCVPTRPIFEALTERYRGLEEALRRHPWSWHGAAMHLRPAPRRARISVEATGGRQVQPDALRVNPVRQYAFRPVRHLEPVAPPGAARAIT